VSGAAGEEREGDGAAADALLDARARVVHDLAVRGADTAPHVDAVDTAVRERRWWLEAWPAGAEHVAGQVAQDVQEALLEGHGVRWPRCTVCDDTEPHELHVLPDLGPDPHWVCEASGLDGGPLGRLGRVQRP